jgi:hypothetical protein
LLSIWWRAAGGLYDSTIVNKLITPLLVTHIEIIANIGEI